MFSLHIQQTPKPAAQFPWAEPPLEEHSEAVKQVLSFNIVDEISENYHFYPLLYVPDVDEQAALGNCTMLKDCQHFFIQLKSFYLKRLKIRPSRLVSSSSFSTSFPLTNKMHVKIKPATIGVVPILKKQKQFSLKLRSCWRGSLLLGLRTVHPSAWPPTDMSGNFSGWFLIFCLLDS